MNEGYITVAQVGEAEYTDKKSRFLAHVCHVESDEEFKVFLQQIKARYPDATHHVWAYVLRGDTLRWSDDGEPGGTSGQPTLQVLRGAGMENVCCVTARYFGDTLLGSGGLVRAYSNAARLALKEAGEKTMTPWRQGCFSCSYALYDRLCRLLGDFGAKIEDSSFGAEVELIFTIPVGLEESIERRVRDLSAGSCEIRYGGTVLR